MEEALLLLPSLCFIALLSRGVCCSPPPLPSPHCRRVAAEEEGPPLLLPLLQLLLQPWAQLWQSWPLTAAASCSCLLLRA